MVKAILLQILLLLFSLFAPENKKVKIFLASDSTMSSKEAFEFPETGWGVPFTWFWDSTVTVVNEAKGGRSSKSFRDEGIWQSILDSVNNGDYVLIQFGHNDVHKDDKNRFTTPEQFKINLVRYVKEVKKKKGIPILITPVAMRRFDSTGQAFESHPLYAPKVMKAAAEQKTLLIDLDKKSMELYQEFGAEKSKLLFNYLKKGEHPNYPDGLIDNTHFNELGARLIAQLVLEELKKISPELAKRIITPKLTK
jgi:lysophospholipase L1-like esterase